VRKPLCKPMVVMSALLLAFFISETQAQSCNEPPRNPQNVVINVVDGQPEFSNKFCDEAGSAPGDLCNAIGSRPRMVFKLQGNGANRWEFVRMELSADGTSWNQPVLPQGAYDDLGFSTDPNNQDRRNGWPQATFNGNKRQMTVRNDNCHEFDIHYRLVLRNNDGSEVFLHPRIRNGGTL